IAPGVRRVLVYSRGNAVFSTNGFRAAMPFTVSPTERVSSGPLTPANVIVARQDATAVTPVSLNAGTIFIQPVFLNADGSAQYFLPSAPDTRYLIQATTNFVNWVNLSTNVAIGNFLDLVDLDAPHYPHRFYRSALFDAVIGGLLSGFGRSANGEVHFELTGLQARSYMIQASTNLVDWQTIATRVSDGRTLVFADLEAVHFSQRFYRLKSEQ
ncbi:MAG TPA: hypothetical protein VFT34_14895, partial [Verrucomicrobiae bacterium]|nr:hypothetical protein [Verrucomicrobiae bacterium]